MQLGVVLDGRRSATEIAEHAKVAEENGIAHLWLSGGSRTKDHFLRLSLAATRTKRIQLGPVAISPFEIHPVRIAISLLTLDEMATGRASIVIGGGGDLTATLGVPLRHRVGAVTEAVDIIHLLGRGGEVNYRGTSFQVNGLFSPWSQVKIPPLYVAANRRMMIRAAARKADGIMMTDMPLDHLADLVQQTQSALIDADRDPSKFRISNWFVWNLQETEQQARRQALRTIAFRLYYIKDIAPTIGLNETEALELEMKKPAMIRAIFEGKDPGSLPKRVTDILIDHLTISGWLKDLDDHIDRLRQFETKGLNEMALFIQGDPVPAMKLLGQRVVPALNEEPSQAA
ncbi:MAG TPA: LLM class flavin-dependent oxidoreductase [Candidatus Angelobacter sp.]|nr:LLM class flavin-dependent oxidoreductase [Candidatus Angelobacter sp.]